MNSFKFVRTIGKRDLLHMAIATVTELGSVTLKRIGFFASVFQLNTQHTPTLKRIGFFCFQFNSVNTHTVRVKVTEPSSCHDPSITVTGGPVRGGPSYDALSAPAG